MIYTMTRVYLLSRILRMLFDRSSPELFQIDSIAFIGIPLNIEIGKCISLDILLLEVIEFRN